MSKILIVDDEADICELLSFLLMREKHEVLTANSGNAALELLLKNPVDLILSDIRMADGDGVHLLKTLRSRGVGTPLVFLTGFSDIDEAKAIELGAAGLLSKPFDRKQLKGYVETCLGAKDA